MKRINFTIPEIELNKLDKFAVKHQVSRSEAIRMLIRALVGMKHGK